MSTDALFHSKFLVHWTGGRQITTSEILTPEQEQQYLTLLTKILNEGLYVRTPSAEEAQLERAFGNTWGDERSFDIQFGRLCFTEIRLSEAQAHAKNYGRLGIGFERDFVMNRGGNPVFYIQNGRQGVAAEMFVRIREYLLARSQAGHKDGPIQLKQLEVLMGFTRTMGGQDSQELKFYDEMEWRILHSVGGEKAGLFKPQGDGLWIMPFKRSDVRLIVFPNARVKELALKDTELKKAFSEEHSPMLLTLDDCAHF